MGTGQRRRQGPARAALALAVAIATAAAGAAASGPARAADPPAPVRVTVDTRAGLARVPALGLGVNDAIWDTELGSEATSTLLGDAGVRAVRYPGGSYSDIYHWETHTAPGGYVAPNTDFDTFMASVRRAGAQPIITANYGTGTAQEAAGWVRHANVEKGYGVRYWEIGNENYGNGHYGSAWEADDHEDKSPAAYARGVVEYAAAMKAVDPTVRIGAVLTTPGNWPDGIVAEGDEGTWNQTVLSIAGAAIDFVVLHWYPGGSGAAEALAKPAQVRDITELAREQITRYAGAGSARIGISLTEINAGAGVNTQPGALFAADAFASLWANGVFNVDWWNVRNGIGTVSTVAGQTDYGDFGLFSSGGCLEDGTTCEPPLNTPFAPYHALDLLSSFARPGDQLVRATTSDPLVRVHAARRPNGDLAVLLLNEDPDAARTVRLDYPGFRPAPGRPAVSRYLNGAGAITTGRTGSAGTQELPAYSLTSVVLRPDRARRLPPAPGTPAVSAVTDTTATVAWAAPKDAPYPASYAVLVQDDAGARPAVRTTRRSLALTGLAPGTRYTVTVQTLDGAGRASWSSAPATFWTGTPALSTCAVKLTTTSDWGNGYVAGIDVTNTGDQPLTGWTLGFTFPRPWQGFGSGWSATWAADGQRVTAANPDATLEPGATATVGFVGNYGGPNVPPRLFTLNGTLCTTTS